MQKIHQLFKQTMDRHGIRGKDLAPLAGITPNHLSDFRSGKTWISPEVFMAMLSGIELLAPGSRRYFCQLLAEEPMPEKRPSVKEKLVEMIETADDEEIEAVLLAVGSKWKREMQSRNSTESMKNAIAV